MTIQGQIEATKAGAAEAAMKRALYAAASAAEHHDGGGRALGECLCAMLETVGGGAPQYQAFGDVRSDAEWWADIASPIELEAYAAAALRRIPRATFAERARKRIFWMLWQSLSADDRRAFLAKVGEADPP